MMLKPGNIESSPYSSFSKQIDRLEQNRLLKFKI